MEGREPPAADQILQGGTVLSFHDGLHRSEAVALREGTILAVGSRSQVLRHRADETRILDLPPGSAVLPGLIDAHAHLHGLGQSLEQLDLTGTTSAEEVAELVRKALASPDAVSGEWILGRGWDQNDWPEPAFPDHGPLTRVAPQRPVLLTRVDGHAAWANAEALRRAGIGPHTPDPEGGRIHRDPETGEPTGILVDTAVGLVRRRVPTPDAETVARRLLAAQALCHRVGLTGVHDAGINAVERKAYESLARDGRLTLRVHAMLQADLPEGAGALEEWYRRGPLHGPHLNIRSIKVYMDGALGSRGAALLRPYSDEPSSQGLLLSEPADLLRLCLEAFPRGWQVGVHAIGDRANRLVLDTFEDALDRTGVASDAVRPRVEHAQILAPEDRPRFARLGVTASMQPTHCTSDMDWADERLGPERIGGAYVWRTLVESGATLAFGSDFPVERPHPLEGVYAAVTRRHRTPPHGPAGGFLPGERLTLVQAFQAFTTGAARAAFDEDRLGRIEPGFRGDLVVLSGDPTRLERPEDLLDLRVLLTFVDGKMVYEGWSPRSKPPAIGADAPSGGPGAEPEKSP